MTTHVAGHHSYILFELAGATYALSSDDIQQLEMLEEPTPVPNAPAFVDGVISVRGQVIPVLNLRARFGFPRAPHDLRTRLVIVHTAGRTVGLVVDSARDFASIPEGDIQAPPEGITGLSGRWLRGLAHRGDRLVLILDVAELLRDDPAPAPRQTPPGADRIPSAAALRHAPRHV